jgi:hypothetical protein
VLDRARTLRYRGAIDDQHDLGVSRPKPGRDYLRPALEALLAGGEVEAAATPAPGCPLPRYDAAGASPVAGGLTFHRDISRILQRRCEGCHREGGAAPFPLVSYEDVRGNRAAISRAVSEGLMPPWFARAGSGPWKNDRSLTAEERGALLSWIDAGCEEGDPGDAPLPKRWPASWEIGAPDAVLASPRAFAVPAEGPVSYQYQTIDTAFDGDRWIRAIEVRPGRRQAVHHAQVYLKYPEGHPLAKDPKQVLAFISGLSGYMIPAGPGQWSLTFGGDQGLLLPKGASLVLQLHYNAIGIAFEDTVELGLRFADTRPAHPIEIWAVSNLRFVIPRGAAGVEVSETYTLPGRTRLLAFQPHMHYRGRSFRIELALPGGGRRTLLEVPRYDFDWQIRYELAEPVDAPKGAALVVTGVFDNSAANARNPDPGADVSFGLQSTDEMMVGYFTWHPLEEDAK